MKTRFILINTSHAGNVGATARAMKTMGFDDLVLVARQSITSKTFSGVEKDYLATLRRAGLLKAVS